VQPPLSSTRFWPLCKSCDNGQFRTLATGSFLACSSRGRPLAVSVVHPCSSLNRSGPTPIDACPPRCEPSFGCQRPGRSSSFRLTESGRQMSLQGRQRQFKSLRTCHSAEFSRHQVLLVIKRPLPGFHHCGRISIYVRCTLGPVIGAANFAVLEGPDLAGTKRPILLPTSIVAVRLSHRLLNGDVPYVRERS